MEYLFKLTEEDLKAVSAALIELPFKIAAPVINKLNRQISEQGMSKPAEKTEDVK